MRIEIVRIRNFRALEGVEIRLDAKLTVLVGTNNAGKTSVLDAIVGLLSYRGAPVFNELDFRSTSETRTAAQAPAIIVEVVVAPSVGTQFDPAELGTHLPQKQAAGDRFLLLLETVWNPDPTVDGIESTLYELRGDGYRIRELPRFPFPEHLPIHHFGAERDLQRGLSSRWSHWGKILAETRPVDAVRTEAISRLRMANNYLVDNTPGLQVVRDALGAAGTMTGMGAMAVSLAAAPQDVDELLRRVAIELQLPGAGRAFGAERHGLGTQGALLFAVYRLHAQRFCDGRPTASPMMIIEEPETHLHPTAQRALAGALRDLPGQVVITSHSPELASAAGTPVILRNVHGKTIAKSAPWPVEFAEHSRSLFAKCVVLAEGLEARALNACAKAMGFDMHARGVEIVNVRGQGNIVPLWKTVGPLGLNLPVVCIADADDRSPLDAFLSALKMGGLIPEFPVEQDRYSVLHQFSYFVPKEGRGLEEALVEDFAADVDAVLNHKLGESFPEWKQRVDNSRLSRKNVNRLNAIRGPLQPAMLAEATIGTLSDEEARIVRLWREKSLVPDVIELLTSNGTNSSRLPKGYRDAMETIEMITRG